MDALGIFATVAPMNDAPLPMPDADGSASDAERQLTVELVQRAMANDAITFDELDERFTAIYQAESRADLAKVVADLPQPPAPRPPARGHLLPSSSFSIFGDLKLGGWVSVENDLQYSAIFGDIVIDLSSAELPNEVRITTTSLFGDTTVILPDGVRASVESMVLLGDRKTDLAPAWNGSPTVRIEARKVFGDVKVYSLSRVPEGPFRKLWKALRSG